MIAENIEKLYEVKAEIKQAIEDKGVENVGNNFTLYPEKIRLILSGEINLDYITIPRLKEVMKRFLEGREYDYTIPMQEIGEDYRNVISPQLILVNGYLYGKAGYPSNRYSLGLSGLYDCKDVVVRVDGSDPYSYSLFCYLKPFLNYLEVSDVNSTDCSEFITNCGNVEHLTKVVLNNFRINGSMSKFIFGNNNSGTFIDLEFNGCSGNITGMSYALNGLTNENIDFLKNFTFNDGCNFSYFLIHSPNVKVLPELRNQNGNTVKVADTFPIINASEHFALKRVEGLDISLLVRYGFTTYFDFSPHYMLLKGLGTNKDMYEFSGYYNWGVPRTLAQDAADGVNTLDARQSVIDTLITYSADRSATTPCAIHKMYKWQFTDSEIAQITSKGYSLV